MAVRDPSLDTLLLLDGVSPYARRDHVSHTVFDHTSILKTVEEKWNLPALHPSRRQRHQPVRHGVGKARNS